MNRVHAIEMMDMMRRSCLAVIHSHIMRCADEHIYKQYQNINMWATVWEKIAVLENQYMNILEIVTETKNDLRAHISKEDQNYSDFRDLIEKYIEAADKKYATKEEIENKLRLPNMFIKWSIIAIWSVLLAILYTWLQHILPNLKL